MLRTAFFPLQYTIGLHHNATTDQYSIGLTHFTSKGDNSRVSQTGRVDLLTEPVDSAIGSVQPTKI